MKNLIAFNTRSNDEIIFKAKLQSAQNGSLPAMVSVAELFYEGTGCMQDKAEAAKWYRKAYEQGDITAGYNLGAMTFYGDGIKQNLKAAKKLFQETVKMAKNIPSPTSKNIIENISSFADEHRDFPEGFAMSQSERYYGVQIQNVASDLTTPDSAPNYLKKQHGRKALLESNISASALDL